MISNPPLATIKTFIKKLKEICLFLLEVINSSKIVDASNSKMYISATPIDENMSSKACLSQSNQEKESPSSDNQEQEKQQLPIYSSISIPLNKDKSQ